MKKWKELWDSKKFKSALIGTVVIIVGHFSGLPEDALEKVFWIFVSLIGGIGIADLGKEKAKIEKEKNDIPTGE